MQASLDKPAALSGRLVCIAYWTTPSLVFLALYWSGLRAAYFRDDFAWLSLASGVRDLPSLLQALFQPFAQGSIRPISERLLFLAGWTFFGMDALPLRVLVFATQIASLVVLCALMRRITGSAVAGFLAPAFWIVNSNIYLPLTWTSAYNQILCALTLLLAMLFFVRHTQTGLRRDYLAQWAVFLFGFGVLELTVVYPALALLYALCCAPSYWRSTIPLFGVSAVYAIVHRAMAPPMTSDMYRMYVDAGMLRTLATYIEWTAGATAYAMYREMTYEPFQAAQYAVLSALACATGVLLYRRQWLALFFAGWFFLVLAPMLPLRNHVTHYYLTIPAIGWSMLGAWSVALALRSRQKVLAVAAVALAIAYAVPSAWAGRGMSREFSATSRQARTFLGGVASAHRRHPGKALLIRNVSSELYWSAWRDNPFPLFGANRVFLTAESAAAIKHLPPGELDRAILPDLLAAEALVRGDVAVYSVIEGGRLRNETALLRAAVPLLRTAPLPAHLNAGDRFSQPLLGEGWYSSDANFRWTAQAASLRLRGPLSESGVLVMRGHCPAALELETVVDGQPLGSRHVEAGGFRFDLPLPLSTVGKRSIDVRLRVSRTIRSGSDPRQVGLAFGEFTVRP